MRRFDAYSLMKLVFAVGPKLLFPSLFFFFHCIFFGVVGYYMGQSESTEASKPQVDITSPTSLDERKVPTFAVAEGKAPIFVPLPDHPLWGKSIKFMANCVPEELAGSLLAQAESKKDWQDQGRGERVTASFVTDDDIEKWSFYDNKLAKQSTWPEVSELTRLALAKLKEWLPSDFSPQFPNYVLANWYPAPDSYARWHQDVPEPIADWILSASVGGARVFLLRALPVESSNLIYFINLPARSALLLGPGVNKTHLHCIPPCDAEEEEVKDRARISFRGPRLNFTFRHILDIDGAEK